MRHNFALEQILGRNPRDVSRLFRSLGIDPDKPYRAQVTLSSVIIEQDRPGGESQAPDRTGASRG